MGNHKDPWPPGYEIRIKELFACDEELSMKDWADLLGCERKAIYNYRNCVSLPNAWKIYLLCKYAGCTSDWLLFGTGPKPDWFKKERVRRVQ
jgi:hypothetical protein